ncbi:glycoprotein-N-acetylgalactosamine 3-beta-galactosyltransferase 1 [Brachyhypopomus gauderio]|uniref:glycoprotein-N-acetylgalactosamine 3-beta-galactosyltransferase 1 n=1 Tax=Brachyhypopomus gauderio TaxID=698409 RepID=UPI004040EE94
MPHTFLLSGAVIGFVLCHLFVKSIFELSGVSRQFIKAEQRFPLELNISSWKTDEVAKQLFSKVRVLCWIMTQPQNLQKKTQHVRASWARHCNTVLYVSSETTDFPTVGLNVSEGRHNLYWKTIRAFQYIHTHHLHDAEWFLKADDDTFVVMENLRHLLCQYDPEKPVYLGHKFRVFIQQGYMSGGAGYVLSRAALQRFVQGFRSGQCQHFSSLEDMAMGKCMETMKVRAGDSRDEKERETFNPFPPTSHLLPPDNGKQSWGYSYYPTKKGPGCCSDYAISFHYISPIEMYVLQYYTYYLRAFGYKHRFNPVVSSNCTLKS